ncbi:MAG: hypothetical protein KC464_05620, partial [Myxococcales bacterium]|nr:hypothetical protein [Myxococcales bacterium]
PAARRQRGGRVGVPYLVESIVEPDAVVVPGYAAGVMPRLAAPPVALTDHELVALVVSLAAQGPGAAPVDAATLATARHEVAAARGR